MYGKSTETAIAALSYLAEVYDGGETLLSASEIADSRGLPRPFVSKILSTLSQAELITGTRGPGGGFAFALHPRDVTLYDVYVLFEQENQEGICPIGGGVCGGSELCPIHDRFAAVRKAADKVLHQTTFDVFRLAYRKGNAKAIWRLSGGT